MVKFFDDMTDLDKTILSSKNDDFDNTDYEAWLKEHDLEVKVEWNENMVRQNHCGGYVAGDLAAELDRPTLANETALVADHTFDYTFEKPANYFGWAKLLIVITPILFLVSYYSYDEVRASFTRIYSGAAALPSLATTTIGLTFTPDNLKVGLVGHFTFDGMDMDWSSSTAEVIDRSEFNNWGNAIDIGQSNTMVGKIGQALVFNGNTSYIDIGNPAVLNLSDENRFTLSAWVYPTATPNGVGVITEMYNTTDTTVHYELGFDMDLASGLPGSKLAVGFFDGTWRIVKDSVNIPLNQWVFITGTWDGTTLSLYKNGIQVNSSNPGVSLPLANYDKVVIGKRHDTAGTTNFFPGKIDEARIYNRGLSSAEVAQLYSLGYGSTIRICKETSVEDADSNTYNTLAIGSQCWLDRNINVGTRIAIASTQTNNSTIEKYCFDNLDVMCTNSNPKKPDGGLYQWNEAMQYSTTEGARGICPIGFHIPTDADWHKLEKFLVDGGVACSSTRTSYDCAPAGTKLKTGGSSLFEGNRAGYSIPSSSYFRGSYGFWWSSSFSGGNTWNRVVFSAVNRFLRSTSSQANGLSVRCLQD